MQLYPHFPCRAGLAADTDFALQATAAALAGDVAALIGIEASEVFASLCGVPDNLLALLDSPQGWTALAGFVSADLGAAAPDYRPVLH